mmetsp:Transcript_35961/g.99076  ORF Transcript_35961/g.99076 Transcript_35961/m.99076 type:complete len:186 (+) Transcript_35961:658-1215(+)
MRTAGAGERGSRCSRSTLLLRLLRPSCIAGMGLVLRLTPPPSNAAMSLCGSQGALRAASGAHDERSGDGEGVERRRLHIMPRCPSGCCCKIRPNGLGKRVSALVRGGEAGASAPSGAKRDDEREHARGEGLCNEVGIGGGRGDLGNAGDLGGKEQTPPPDWHVAARAVPPFAKSGDLGGRDGGPP